MTREIAINSHSSTCMEEALGWAAAFVCMPVHRALCSSEGLQSPDWQAGGRGWEQILVVEDVMLLAEALGDVLLEAELEPVGPAATVDMGLYQIETSQIDAAILDIRLVGEVSFPVAYA